MFEKNSILRILMELLIFAFYQERLVFLSRIRTLFDKYLANGANINTVRSNFRQLTVLQDAVMMTDLPLICELLKRGASTDVKGTTHCHDGSPSRITGLTTYKLPGFLGKKMNDPIYQKILKMFDDYSATKGFVNLSAVR